MACHNDFDGVYFSVQALSMYHPRVMPHAEILVIDNDPHGYQGALTRDFITNWVHNGRYVGYSECVGTAAPCNRLFEEALGDYVLCIDAHVLLVPRSLERLLDFYEQNSEIHDLLQGPLLCDDLKTFLYAHGSCMARGNVRHLGNR